MEVQQGADRVLLPGMRWKDNEMNRLAAAIQAQEDAANCAKWARTWLAMAMVPDIQPYRKAMRERVAKRYQENAADHARTARLIMKWVEA